MQLDAWRESLAAKIEKKKEFSLIKNAQDEHRLEMLRRVQAIDERYSSELKEIEYEISIKKQLTEAVRRITVGSISWLPACYRFEFMYLH